jgi:hypothetical protein
VVDRKRVVVVALLGLVLSTTGRAGAVEDPFRPPQGLAEPVSAGTDGRPEGLEVSMILRGPDRSTAMIGEHTLGIGDRIEGFTVVAIDREGVILERAGERIELEPSPDLRSIRSSESHSVRQSTGTP